MSLDIKIQTSNNPHFASRIRFRPIPLRKALRRRISKARSHFATLGFVGVLAIGGSIPAVESFNPVSPQVSAPPVTTAQNAVFAPLPIASGLGERYVLVDLSEQKLKAFEQGQQVFEAVISSGDKNRPTPRGEFKIRNKSPRAYSSVAHLYMPYWMAFAYNGEHWLGFHELPEYPDGRKEGQEHLGQPYSGGCVRLGIGAAEQFYAWAKLGDKVLVY